MTHQPSLPWRLIAAAAIVVAAAISCDAPTGPGELVHPAGTPSGRVSIPGSPSSIAISSGGIAYVTLLGGNALARFDAATPAATAYTQPVAVQPTDVIFDRAGTTALLAAWDPSRVVVYTIDVASGNFTNAREMQDRPHRIVLSRDESRLFVLTVGDPARVYSYPYGNLFNGKSYVVQIPGQARALAVSPTTGALIVATSTRVARLDPDSISIQAITGPLLVNSEQIAVSPNGSRIWVGSLDGNLVALDATSLDKVAEVQHGADIRGVAMSPDGSQLLATSLGDLLVVDPAKASLVTRIPLGGTAAHIAFDRAGATAFVSNQAGWVDIIR